MTVQGAEQVVAHVPVDPDDGGGVWAQEFEVFEHEDEIGGRHVTVHNVRFELMIPSRRWRGRPCAGRRRVGTYLGRASIAQWAASERGCVGGSYRSRARS